MTGGDDPDNPPFGRIREVSVLSDGSVVVGDISTSEVMIFDTLGRLTHRFGGKGDGPGELRDFGAASTCGEDAVITSDPYAFFDRLKADDEGNLWVRALATPDPAPERWTVLGSGGRWLGVVRMPGGFTLSTVARGRVHGVHRDELGVATVRVYRLQRGG